MKNRYSTLSELINKLYAIESIRILWIQFADLIGLWVCHMEEYVFLGGRGAGRKVEARINVTVQV